MSRFISLSSTSRIFDMTSSSAAQGVPHAAPGRALSEPLRESPRGPAPVTLLRRADGDRWEPSGNAGDGQRRAPIAATGVKDSGRTARYALRLFARLARYSRQPPYAVISRMPSQSAGSPSTPSVSSPSANLTLPIESPGGSFDRISASPAGGTDHTSTAIAAPPDVTRSIAGCTSLIDQSR